MRHRHPRFYEIEDFSDYREPNFAKGMLICGVVIITALLAFCLSKKLSSQSMGGSACGVCTSARATRNQDAKDGVVHVKDGDHLKELIHYGGPVVIMFYAPWCGHCATLKPEFISAAQQHNDVLYAMCDCENSVGMDVVKEHQIEGFPTIRFYDGKLIDEYNGPRVKASIMNWTASHAKA